MNRQGDLSSSSSTCNRGGENTVTTERLSCFAVGCQHGLFVPMPISESLIRWSIQFPHPHPYPKKSVNKVRSRRSRSVLVARSVYRL
jgi:hypothetical protein